MSNLRKTQHTETNKIEVSEKMLSILEKDAEARMLQAKTDSERYKAELSIADKNISAEKEVQLDNNNKALKDRNANRVFWGVILFMFLTFVLVITIAAPAHADKIITAMLGALGGSGLTTLYFINKTRPG
jgi:Trk-type K+ transport system membrane component